MDVIQGGYRIPLKTALELRVHGNYGGGIDELVAVVGGGEANKVAIGKELVLSCIIWR